ncbi:MAG: alpha/beta hydrolase fold domain-containing protein [Planctomycetaceae bacterium]|nr:alpha/beta hydrolase fold domain-containing protein [Planctomycetaceae bacterium]MBT6487745.1 alpha/beta hydrolase fold domain-containing protein [Planctomycetaceae bacterium]MBT6493540.1 alpha/beta hydrolase fold domain-containing protein [Planctomycetaceae bacterium]
MQFLRPVAIVGSLVLMLAASSFAQETDSRKTQENAVRTRLLDNIFRVPPNVKLDEEQKAKLKALREKRGAEVAQKMQGILRKLNGVYTDEQRQARNIAFRDAREAKKNRRETQQAVVAAIKLTKEQQKQIAAIRRERIELQASIRGEIIKELGIQPRRRNRPQVARIRPTQANVKYGPHERNVLDFWEAKSEQPTPVLVSIHGGGFRGGNKSVSGAMLKQCLDAGISVVAITYRFSQHAIAPASFNDSARAIQFVRHHAKEWNIDPTRLAATGGSAGAGISLWLGFHDNMADADNEDPVLRQSTRLTCMFVNNGQSSYDPRFIRDLFPGTDTYRHSALPQLFGIDISKLDDLPKGKYELFEEVSAIPHLTKDDPPVILIYNRPFDADITNQSIGIHHAKFGAVLKERMDALDIPCRVFAAGKSLDGEPILSSIDFLKQNFKLEK